MSYACPTDAVLPHASILNTLVEGSPYLYLLCLSFEACHGHFLEITMVYTARLVCILLRMCISYSSPRACHVDIGLFSETVTMSVAAFAWSLQSYHCSVWRSQAVYVGSWSIAVAYTQYMMVGYDIVGIWLSGSLGIVISILFQCLPSRPDLFFLVFVLFGVTSLLSTEGQFSLRVCGTILSIVLWGYVVWKDRIERSNPDSLVIRLTPLKDLPTISERGPL